MKMNLIADPHAWVAAGAILLPLFSATLPASSQPTSVFDVFVTPAGSAPAAPARRRSEMQARVAMPAAPTALASHTLPGCLLRVQFFDDATFVLIVTRREVNGPGTVSVSGHDTEAAETTFSLVLHQGVLVGHVRDSVKGRLFRIEHAGPAMSRVVELDPDKCGECGVGRTVPRTGGPTVSTMNGGPKSLLPCFNRDDGSQIDVLVIYTDVARQAALGTYAIQAEALAAVNDANQAYVNSRIGPRLRLVHTEEIAYGENGTFEEHLNRLTDPQDGVMDGVHGIRDDYGADVVTLLVDDRDCAGNRCVNGMAHLMTSLSHLFEDRAFSVVNWQSAGASEYALAHEIGHNMGCGHERDTNASGGLYSYSHGQRFTGTDGVLYRTVMAYPPGNRIPYFSNPEVLFHGRPTGVPLGQPDEAHNALTINNSAWEVANWRQSITWVDFAGAPGCTFQCGSFECPYSSLGWAIGSTPISGTIRIKPGASSETLTISKPLTIEAPMGIVTIGR